MPTIHILPLWAVKVFLEHVGLSYAALLAFWWDERPEDAFLAAKKAGLHVLDLCVADTELSREEARKLGLKTFSEEYARLAARFLVEAYQDGVRLFVFACEAGRSRSAGAANAFARWLAAQGEDMQVWPMFPPVPNLRVQRLLGEALFDLESLSERELVARVEELLRRPVEWDDDGYPTEKSLKSLRAWFEGFFPRVEKLPKEARDELFRKTKLLFFRTLLENHYGKDGVRIRTEESDKDKQMVLEYHTFGWSGNEDVISLLERVDHGLWWQMFWRKTECGGHYEFEVPEDIAQTLGLLIPSQVGHSLTL